MFSINWRRMAAFVLVSTSLSIAAGHAAFAVVPEIVLDPRTSKAVPQADLETALVRLTFANIWTEPRTMVGWRHAPWHVN